MRIASVHSHLNGREFLQVHRPGLWREIEQCIAGVEAEACRTKVSREARTMGHLLYSPIEMNRELRRRFNLLDWQERREGFWLSSDPAVTRRNTRLPAAQQKQEIVDAGLLPISSHHQTDLLKDRVAIEVQFGKYPFAVYDLYVKHPSLIHGNISDVGIEILPMKELQARMSSGVPYYEQLLHCVARDFHCGPSVPLVLIGIAPDVRSSAVAANSTDDPVASAA